MARFDTVVFNSEALTRARLSRFMSRADLARAAGVSYGVVWCAGNRRGVTIPKAQALARALGCDLRAISESISSGNIRMAVAG